MVLWRHQHHPGGLAAGGQDGPPLGPCGGRSPVIPEGDAGGRSTRWSPITFRTYYCAPAPPRCGTWRRKGSPRAWRWVGDVMTECLLSIMDSLDDAVPERFGVKKGGYVLATIHRQENADSRENMEAIVGAMCDYGGDVVLPAATPGPPRDLSSWGLMGPAQRRGQRKSSGTSGLLLSFTAMERHAKKIMTDSGGVQKEALFLGRPLRHGKGRDRMDRDAGGRLERADRRRPWPHNRGIGPGQATERTGRGLWGLLRIRPDRGPDGKHDGRPAPPLNRHR